MNLQELRQKRLKWVEANRENGFDDGIKRLLTDLYPDNAHFIFELLQNAEDARASEARFILKEDSVEFEHNGDRLFSIKDVESITSIGISTKRDDHTNIGKFGVGFKAVFSYTSTPEIKSGEYHFRICDLVVPDTKGLSSVECEKKKTYFIFPFDNPDKSPDMARVEIEKNLRQLNESSLLFLSNIKKIEYLLPDSTLGFLERKKIDENQIEILVQHPEDSEPASVVFLRFEKQVAVQDEDDKPKLCRIAAAFGLEKTKEQNWKIRPLEPGRVCIYFPAEKETSNLKFHLHAPFASTIARDSVRDCEANNDLRDHLADLIAESMTNIRDQKLLDVAFLATLPNDRDSLVPFYKPIQEQLVETFNNEELTPMKQGSHAAASETFRGQARLSDLISDSDLAKIWGDDYCPPMWIANPPQRNQREDNFLSMLYINEWTTEDLVSELSANSESIMKWLTEKPDEWHQRLYALLGDFLSSAPSYPSYVATKRKNLLSKLRIIRCSDGEYRVGSECYFPSDDVENDEQFPRVAKGVYLSGNNKQEQEKAHKFLEELGIRERDLVEEVIKEILPKYRDNSVTVVPEENKRDLKKIEQAYKTDSQEQKERLRKQLRVTPFILAECPSLKKTVYRKPDQIYFRSDDLNIYFFKDDSFACVNPDHPHSTLLKDLGVSKTVRIHQRPKNLEGYVSIVRRRGYHKRGLDGFDPDIHVEGLECAMANPNPQKSTFIWNEIAIRNSDCIRGIVETATRQSYEGSRKEKQLSEFGQLLIDTAWLPDSNGNMHTPSELTLDDLPESFVRDEKLADQLGMKKNVVAKLAEEVGISTGDIELLRQDPEGFRLWKAEREEKGKKPEFPERVSANLERREKQLRDQVKDSPEKEYKTRERSTRTTRGEIEPDIYLRNQYTNQHDQLICQICKEEMPFKKRDDEYYFEAVEALSGDYFHKEHEAQFLALCPECAARYKEFVKRDETILSKLHRALKSSDKPEVPLKLGELETSLQFVETHWQNMKTILQAVVDRSDSWSEQDQKDLTTASLQYAEVLYPEEEDLV